LAIHTTTIKGAQGKNSELISGLGGIVMAWNVDEQDEVTLSMLRRVQCAPLEGTKWKEGIWNWVCGAVRDIGKGRKRSGGKGKEMEGRGRK
jgi:hypothetical protein